MSDTKDENPEAPERAPHATLHSLQLHELDTPLGKTVAEETIASDSAGAVTMRLDFSNLAELLAQALAEAERRGGSGGKGG